MKKQFNIGIIPVIVTFPNSPYKLHQTFPPAGDQPAAIARLIELGRQKSYVTLDDILHFFPEAEQDVEQLEEAFSALLSAGIPFVEDTPPGEPTEDELAAVEEAEA